LEDWINLPEAVLRPLLQSHGMEWQEFRRLRAFMPEAVRRRGLLIQNGIKLVHYTTSDIAIKIARSGKLWMRNARGMRDYSEITRGISHVDKFFLGPAAQQFWAALDVAHPGTSEKIFAHYEGWKQALIDETYIACVSEHGGGREDQDGRLSLWEARQHGGKSYDVAIVVRSDVVHQVTSALMSWSYPVIYRDISELETLFLQTVDGVSKDAELLGSMSSEDALSLGFETLLSYCVSIKHPSMHEEKEWRIVHHPRLWRSDRVKSEVVTYNGSPELVYQMPLQSFEDEGLKNISIPELVERVIIGPMNPDRAANARRALLEVMTDVKIPDPENKLFVSTLPLRDY
jgi:hypothetical protein